MNTDETKMHILLLEDQEDDADLTIRAVRKGGILFDSIRVDNREAFEKAIDEFNPDLILSDHSLPLFNSIEALKIRASKSPDTPFILVTGAVSDEFAAQCIKLGADDYILKSNLSRLPSSIKNAMEYRRMERLRVDAEKSLRDQNVQLTRAHSEIDSFVYSISHNLRSPLASVLGLVDLAQQAKTLADVQEYIKLIERSARKLDETIKEIIDYSQNEHIDIEYKAVDLRELVEECLEKLQYMPGFNEMTKKIKITNTAACFADKFRVSIILMNLFSNSIKFRDRYKEFKLLQIKGTITPENTVIEVTDNGVGILAERISLIFKMFYRGHESSDGAGLGLYIAKGVVEKLGGTISVKSEPELLTTFTITLPNKNPMTDHASA